MTTATIFRPTATTGFTALPNAFLNHAEIGLKPRDASVLNYLFSKPEKGWKICPAAIGRALCIGESTARRALTNLVKKGFASYQRFPDGHTEWVIKTPATLDISPQSQKPSVEKPQVAFGSVLEIKDYLEINKETTNVVVPAFESVQIQSESKLPTATESLPPPEPQPLALPETVSETDKKAIKAELKKLVDSSKQIVILQILTAALLKGTVGNPVGYIVRLVEKANNGALSEPIPPKNTTPPLQKEQERQNRLFAFFTKNLEQLKKDFFQEGKFHIHSSSLGTVTRSEFENFLKTERNHCGKFEA